MRRDEDCTLDLIKLRASAGKFPRMRFDTLAAL